MFRGSFGGKPLYLARIEAANLAKLGKPVPQDFVRANTFMNYVGPEPARGWVLMRREDLDAIDLNAIHNLVLDYVDQENPGNLLKKTLTFYNLVIAKEPLNLTPSNVANDADSVYLVEIADSRWRVHNPYFSVPINKQYEGTTYTWATLVADIWSLMSAQLGSAPSLPFAPDGTPNVIAFPGMSAWEALTQILTRIGCAVKGDLTQATGQYSIVRVGSADASTDAILANYESPQKIHDGEYMPIVRGRVPYGVRVYFAEPRNLDGSVPTALYSVDVVGPEAADAEPGIYHPIWDDMTPTMNSLGQMNSRATERANDFYRMLENGGNRLHKIYSGLINVSPGSTLKAVGWRFGDGAGEVVTEVVRHPMMPMGRKLNDFPGQMPVKKARATTIAAMPSYSRTGNVITFSSLAALDVTIFDGVNVRLGDRVLVNSGAAGVNAGHKDYGLYTITSMPDVAIAIVTHGNGVSVNQVQSIAINGASGGNFTLDFDATDGGSPLTTAGIAWNASGATIKTALENLANITSVTILSGTGTSTDPYLVRFNDSFTDYLPLKGNVCKTLTISGLTPTSSITFTRSPDANVSEYLPAGTLVVVTEGPGPGAYNNALAYVAGNVVSYNGYAYQSISGSTGILPTDTMHWNLWDRYNYADSIWELETDNPIILNRSPLHWRHYTYYAGTNVSLSGTYNEIISSTDTTQVIVDKNGTLVGTRQELNFIEGNGIAITAVDNSGANRVDLTFAIQSGATISSLTITNLTSTTITTTNETVTSTLIIPNGTSVTTNTAGEIAIDTNGDGTNVTQGWVQYYDGTHVMYVPGVDAYPTVNGDVLTYDSTLHKLVWAAPGAGTVTIEGDTGGAQSGPAFVLTTDVNAAYTGFSFAGSSNTFTLQIPYADGDNAVEGIVSGTTQTFAGVKTFRVETADTNGIENLMNFSHTCSGTVANGFGASQVWYLETSNSGQPAQVAQTFTWIWDSATYGSQTSHMTVNVVGGSGSGILMEYGWNGSNAVLSFFGVTMVAQQTGDVGAALVAFGLMTGTPTFDGANLLNAGTAFTQTYATSGTTLNAYTTDNESSAFSGIDKTQAGTPYAQVADLNQLRAAYENLRASHDNLLSFVNGIVDALQAMNIFT